jgi:hypothetical protein
MRTDASFPERLLTTDSCNCYLRSKRFDVAYVNDKMHRDATAAHRRWTEGALNTDIQVERWPIERLIPRATNPRTHSREQIANIAASMRELGWTNPILVGADNDIIAPRTPARSS